MGAVPGFFSFARRLAGPRALYLLNPMLATFASSIRRTTTGVPMVARTIQIGDTVRDCFLGLVWVVVDHDDDGTIYIERNGWRSFTQVWNLELAEHRPEGEPDRARIPPAGCPADAGLKIRDPSPGCGDTV
jgi:hypothetical protein